MNGCTVGAQRLAPALTVQHRYHSEVERRQFITQEITAQAQVLRLNLTRIPSDKRSIFP